VVDVFPVRYVQLWLCKVVGISTWFQDKTIGDCAYNYQRRVAFNIRNLNTTE